MNNNLAPGEQHKSKILSPDYGFKKRTVKIEPNSIPYNLLS